MSIIRATLALCLSLGALATPFAEPVMAQGNSEAKSLLDHQRASRLEAAASIQSDFEIWFRENRAFQPPHLRSLAKLALETAIEDSLSFREKCSIAASFYMLAGEPRLDNSDLRDPLLSAAAFLAQEVLVQASESRFPLSLSVDSLRTMGDVARVPQPIGAVTWVAPVPPPETGEPESILIESQTPQRVSLEGQVIDWFDWMPLRETLVYRTKNRVTFTPIEDGTADTLLVESSPNGPFPSISASGEYFATVSSTGSLWLKRFGISAAVDSVNMDSPITAIAFAPSRLELAYATQDKNVWLYDFSGTNHRLLANADNIVRSIHWSPRGDMLAWSTSPRGAFNGFAQVRGHSLFPKTPKEAGISLASPSQWSPDGSSILGIGTGPEGSGLYLWDGTSERLLDGGFPLTNADLSVAWDFEQIAYAEGEPLHPQPFGFDAVTPFAFDASPRSVMRLNWNENQILDRPLHRARDLCWDHQSRWLVHTLDERAESFGTTHLPLRQGLWAMNVETGEHIPLQRDPGSYSLPLFSPRGGWLGYLRSSGVEGVSPELWVRPMKTRAAKSRVAERMRLRSVPLLRKGDYEEAVPFLRDALRMNPDLESARLELSQAYRRIAGTVPSSAEAGLLLAAATREITRLVAYVPGNPVYREELMETFFAYAVVCGRFYSFEAAERGRQLLAADPEATSDPDRVTQVIQPVLLDAWAWDPFHFEAREMLRGALEHFRRARH